MPHLTAVHLKRNTDGVSFHQPGKPLVDGEKLVAFDVAQLEYISDATNMWSG